MNDNIIKTQIFNEMNFDHKGHLRSHKVIFAFEKKNVSLISFSFKFVSTYSKLSQNDNF